MLSQLLRKERGDDRLVNGQQHGNGTDLRVDGDGMDTRWKDG